MFLTEAWILDDTNSSSETDHPHSSSFFSSQRRLHNAFGSPKRQQQQRSKLHSSYPKNDWTDRLRAAIGIEEEQHGMSSSSSSSWYSKRKEELKKQGATMSQLEYLALLMTEWMEKVAKSVLETKRSHGLFHGIYTAALNVLKGYVTGIQILFSYPLTPVLKNTSTSSTTATSSSNTNTNHQNHQQHCYTTNVQWKLVQLVSDTFVGAMSGALMMTTGVATGIYQLLTGIQGTYEGLYANYHGMIWDEITASASSSGQYGFFDLEQKKKELNLLLLTKPSDLDEEDDQNSDGQRGTKEFEEDARRSNERNNREPNLRTRSKKRVQDASYYKLLKVSPDASSSEIKRAYYQMAMNVHPDKNPTDKSAALKFQSLSSAYQTLSNNESREAYDTYGTCFRTNEQSNNSKTSPNPDVDPYIFFATFFGSYLVEPYIGELSIATKVDNILDLSSSSRIQKRKDAKVYQSWQQQKRQVDIALNLRERIKAYDTPSFSSNKKENEKTKAQRLLSRKVFRASCREEAMGIGRREFGNVYLTAIGHALVSESNKYLGYQTSFLGVRGGVSEIYQGVSQVSYKLSTTWELGKTVKASIVAFIEARKEQREKENNLDSCEETNIMTIMAEKMERALPSILELGWKINVQDISYTVSEACAKLLAEPTMASERLRRAEAIQILGNEFINAASTVDAKKKDTGLHQTKVRVESAFWASVVVEDENDIYQQKHKRRRATA